MGRGTPVRVLETTCARPKACPKRTYQQQAPFRTEGFIQLRRSWPAVRQAANNRHGSDFPVFLFDRFHPHQRAIARAKAAAGHALWVMTVDCYGVAVRQVTAHDDAPGDDDAASIRYDSA